MKTKRLILVGTAIIPLLVGCASQPVKIALVGPEPAGHQSYVPQGRLVVFTRTETHEIGDDTFYYPHTGYGIYSESGQRVKYVPNHIGDMDEAPTSVVVPAGKFNLVAGSSSYGRVTVPVVIQPGQTTVVHLDRDWKVPASIPDNLFVYLPDGEVIGWRGSTTKSPD